MKEQTVRSRTALKLTFVATIAVAALAIVLTWQQPAHERAEAAGGGPEMGLSVKSGSTTCPVGTGPDTTCVMGGDPFSLAVEAVGIPASGYILAQTFIDYGTFNPGASEDGAGPNTCSDGIDNSGSDGKDRLDSDCVTVDVIYKPAALASAEFVWPDLLPDTAVRSEFGPGLVGHGALTGLLITPTSFYLGNLVLLDFNCSVASSSTLVQLLPEGDALAGTSGSLYTEPEPTSDQVRPKVGSLTIKCVGPTPTPSDTPIPPTPTPTLSPTPTDTPTPLPPPSERPDVKVTKVDLADPVDSGSAYTYRIKVESVGRQTAKGIVVQDTLPFDSTYKSHTSAGAFCSHNAGVVTCVTADMAPGALVTIDIEINAPSPEADMLVNNTVTVTSTNEPFANTGNNKDTEQTIVLAPRSDVILQKIGAPVFLEGGEDVTYTLIAKNLGPFPAQNVKIVDTLPGSGTFVSATNPECATPSPLQITCELGDIAVNAEVIVEVVWKAPLVTRNEMLKNSAVVSADNELFTDTGNNLAGANTAVIAPPPDLVVSKTDSQDPVLRLGFYSYDITIANEGLGDALHVVATDTLPVATVDLGFVIFLRAATFESAVGATCQAIPDDKVECTLDEINVGQQAVITINVRGPTLLEDESVLNRVTVSASDPDEIPAGNDASEATLVRACFDINGDLIVDLPNDILTMIQSLGLREGDVGFDKIKDFDGDGFVGLPFDLLPVIRHFNQDCSLLL